MTVRVDLPPGAGPAPSPQAVQHGAQMGGAIIGAIVILAMIALNVWVVQRVLRRRRGEL